MEKLLKAVLVLCLLALAVLTPVWWRQKHPPPLPTPAPASPPPTVDPEARTALRYEAALELFWAGKHGDALPLFEELSDFRESRELAESCRETVYHQALEALYRRELGTAAELLRQLGDYEESARWLRYCEKRLDAPAPSADLLHSLRVYYRPKHGLGTLYTVTGGLLYVPNTLDSETKTLLYYPGGSVGTEPALDFDAATDYVSRFAPNALCFFSKTCDFHRIPEKNREIWAEMEELLQHFSLVPHELILVGTSNGFYTAMDLAMQLLDEEELRTRVLMSWDAGEDWGVTDKLLNTEELTRLAEAGTRLVLLEQRNFDPGRRVIRDMLDAGLTVDLIECYNGDHEMITLNAFRYGMMSWALGEQELPEAEYILNELNE